jgi:hypothetical protein
MNRLAQFFPAKFSPPLILATLLEPFDVMAAKPSLFFPQVSIRDQNWFYRHGLLTVQEFCL